MRYSDRYRLIAYSPLGGIPDWPLLRPGGLAGRRLSSHLAPLLGGKSPSQSNPRRWRLLGLAPHAGRRHSSDPRAPSGADVLTADFQLNLRRRHGGATPMCRTRPAQFFHSRRICPPASHRRAVFQPSSQCRIPKSTAIGYPDPRAVVVVEGAGVRLCRTRPPP